jgi:hypothetical protein
MSIMIYRLACVTALVALTACSDLLPAQTTVDADPDEVTVTIDGVNVAMNVPAGVGTFTIPNLHAPMVRLQWADEAANHDQLKIKPLVDRWEIKLPKSTTEQQLQLWLDDPARTTAAVKPIAAAADGGFTIPAHAAHVVGEKLRYELQPWKNTVGYWAVVDDYMYFLIDCDRGGSWNVGLLQGCGQGHGGSDAVISLHGPLTDLSLFATDQAPVESAAVSQIEFNAQETGHFQNFIWRHVGRIELSDPGVYALKISATKIAKGAVMDVRSVSLTRLPD